MVKQAKEASPNWTYLNDGRYTVSLTVTDDRGDKHTTTETIFAEDDNILPEATAKYIHLGRLVTMWSTSTDADGRIVDTEWVYQTVTSNEDVCSQLYSQVMENIKFA